MARNERRISLERFKHHSDGVVALAQIIEQATPEKREKLIEDVQREDVHLLASVLERTVFFEELIYLDEDIIGELVSAVPPAVLAYSLKGTDEDFRKKLCTRLGFREIKQLKDEEEQIGPQPKHELIQGARKEILKIARKLESKEKFKFQLDDCPRFRHLLKKAE
ncbi:MAG: hypothetical protein HY537_18890 [Deltaproteobacteria bacterium]|nr:hypothetical protein [Deltaproteobacteria bacterium]